jgi:putative FmdB family regulatory protein
MPVYEFHCLDCRRRFDVFLSYSEYGEKKINCTRCGSSNIRRKIGRVRIGRSDESRLASMADPDRLANIDEDPRALGHMMRDMKSEVGEDMGPMFDEVVGRLESGQNPEDIERDIPDLADEGGGAGGGMGDLDM